MRHALPADHARGRQRGWRTDQRARIAGLCGADWGLHHTVARTLERLARGPSELHAVARATAPGRRARGPLRKRSKNSRRRSRGGCGPGSASGSGGTRSRRRSECHRSLTCATSGPRRTPTASSARCAMRADRRGAHTRRGSRRVLRRAGRRDGVSAAARGDARPEGVPRGFGPVRGRGDDRARDRRPRVLGPRRLRGRLDGRRKRSADARDDRGDHRTDPGRRRHPDHVRRRPLDPNPGNASARPAAGSTRRSGTCTSMRISTPPRDSPGSPTRWRRRSRESSRCPASSRRTSSCSARAAREPAAARGAGP